MNKVIAFDDDRQIASGLLKEVVCTAKKAVDLGRSVLIFDAVSSRQIEVDYRGSAKDVVERIEESDRARPSGLNEGKNAAPERKGPGRPKLGVVPREVTLLPRHWEWLNVQPGGASVALRRLVEEARKTNAPKDRKREAQESAYRFLSVMAGNLPGYEESLRALYANDFPKFKTYAKPWPRDISQHALALAKMAIHINLPGPKEDSSEN